MDNLNLVILDIGNGKIRKNISKTKGALKEETIKLQQQKVVSQLSQQVVTLALTKVREKLKKSVDDAFHSSVNNFNIVLLTNYKPN